MCHDDMKWSWKECRPSTSSREGCDIPAKIVSRPMRSSGREIVDRYWGGMRRESASFSFSETFPVRNSSTRRRTSMIRTPFDLSTTMMHCGMREVASVREIWGREGVVAGAFKSRSACLWGTATRLTGNVGRMRNGCKWTWFVGVEGWSIGEYDLDLDLDLDESLPYVAICDIG